MLTDQRRRYAEARAKGWGKREAAIYAGCPPKTATQAAARLERNEAVQMAIAAITGGQPLPIPSPTPQRSPVIAEKRVTIDTPPPPVEEDPLPQTDDPIVFMTAVMNCPRAPINERNKAAMKLADLAAKAKPAEEKPKTNKFRKTGNVVPLKAGNGN